MISVKRARKILGVRFQSLSEDQVADLIRRLYSLAEAIEPLIKTEEPVYAGKPA